MSRVTTLIGSAALLLLCACSDDSWQTKDVAGLLPDLEFSLTNDHGDPVSESDYAGRVTLLFFGFTYCPDVCPLTLSKITSVARRLDADPADLTVLFVSVDPERDDLTQISEYVQAFGEHVVGLRGDRAALDAMTKRYRVTYGYGEADAQGYYDVSHSSAVFAFDRQGAIRLLIRETDPPDAIAADLRRLL